jgi:hypothetical protein
MIALHDTGRVEVQREVDGVGLLVEQVYPLCATAVQTEVRVGEQEVAVRPGTYVQPAYYR